MTASTRTSPTETAFGVLTHRDRQAVCEHPTDEERSATADRRIDTITAAEGAGTIHPDVRLQRYHVDVSQMPPPGRLVFDEPDDPVGDAGSGGVEGVSGTAGERHAR